MSWLAIIVAAAVALAVLHFTRRSRSTSAETPRQDEVQPYGRQAAPVQSSATAPVMMGTPRQSSPATVAKELSRLLGDEEDRELVTLTAKLTQAHEDCDFDLVRTDLLPKAIKYKWYQNICALVDKGEPERAETLLLKRIEAELHLHKLLDGEPRYYTILAPDDVNTVTATGLATAAVSGDPTRRRLVISDWVARFDVMLPRALATSWVQEQPLSFARDQRSDAVQFWLVISTDQWGTETRIQFVGTKTATWGMI